MIVCDTHAWIWWASDDRRLSAAARKKIDAASDVIISAISCWEVAMLVAKERLEFDRDVLRWIQDALSLPRVRLVDLTPEIAVEAARLVWNHRDPADRMIVATARLLRAPIATRDETIASYPAVKVVW
ncbi:MAG TPA: type II toxin-antitoxin system VapC family toxin [Thermoanaerobaculia bacterium]